MKIKEFIHRLIVKPWDFRHPSACHQMFKHDTEIPSVKKKVADAVDAMLQSAVSQQNNDHPLLQRDHRGCTPLFDVFDLRLNQEQEDDSESLPNHEALLDVFIRYVKDKPALHEKILYDKNDAGQCIVGLTKAQQHDSDDAERKKPSEYQNFWKTYFVTLAQHGKEQKKNGALKTRVLGKESSDGASVVGARSHKKSLSVMAFAFPWQKIGNWLNFIWPGQATDRSMKFRLLEILHDQAFLNVPDDVIRSDFADALNSRRMYEPDNFLDQLRKIASQFAVFGLVFVAAPFLCLGRYAKHIFDMVRDDLANSGWKAGLLTSLGLCVTLPLIVINMVFMLLVGMVRTAWFLCMQAWIQTQNFLGMLLKLLKQHPIIPAYLFGMFLTLCMMVIGVHWLSSPWWFVRVTAIGHLSLITFFFFLMLYIFVVATGEENAAILDCFPSYISVATLTCFSGIFFLPIPAVENLFVHLLAVNAFTCIIPIVFVVIIAAIMGWRHHHRDASGAAVVDDGVSRSAKPAGLLPGRRSRADPRQFEKIFKPAANTGFNPAADWKYG